jgi:hypothetical protein
MAETPTTSACTDEKDLYGDVLFCKGKKSLPGIRSYAYFIKKKNILTWPTRATSTATTLAEIAKLVGDFVLVADKKWNKIDLIPNLQQVQSEQVGQYGSHLFKNTGTLVIPGTEEEVTGLASELNNDNCVFLVPQRNGKFRMLGNEEFDCEIKPGLDTGKGSEDTNATTLTITIEDEIAAPFYPGTIVTSGGNISGATGKAVTTTP